MANSNGWGDGAANNAIGWGQGANNAIGWGSSHATSWAGATDIVGIDADATAFLTASAITGATQQAAIDNLVKGLKSDGLWSKMKAVYPFVTDNINRLSYTNTLTNAYWQNAQIVITSGQSDVNGGTNATKCAGNSATNAYIYGTTTQTIIGQTYTASVYLRGDSSGSVSFRVDSGGSTPSNPVNYTTSWQRFTYTFVAGFTSADWVIGGYNTWTGSETIYVYAPQLELGSTATTYQPIATTQQAYIASQFKYNLKDPRDLDAAFRLVFNGGWTHSSTGATPNGTNGYADTYLVPSSVLAQNNASLGYYGGATGTSFRAALGSGNSSTNNYFNIYPAFPSFGLFGDINDGSNTFTANTNSAGFILASRLSSTQKKHFIRNVANTLTENSVAPNSFKVFVGARNTNGTAADYFDKQIRYSFIGDGLTDTEAANLYTRVQNFQTSLSRQV